MNYKKRIAELEQEIENLIERSEYAERELAFVLNKNGAGYRKNPEGAVVLTTEERKNLYDFFYKVLKAQTTRARKETAKEILQEFFDWLDFEDLPTTAFIHIMRQDFERRLNDFSKKYGVEVDE